MLYDGDTNLTLRAARIPTRHTRGTGCTCAAATIALPARRLPVEQDLHRDRQSLPGGPSLTRGPSARGRVRWRTAGRDCRSSVRFEATLNSRRSNRAARLIIGGSDPVHRSTGGTWRGESAKRLQAPHAPNTTTPYRST
ncbi:bifunctional hydroxymethylpyrimidine kinase/phosphomethylpyrimidine kinase [Roseiflexus castenholzii]|uniref:bifunctional hydroxymethylpyrimidine kinase/phosphomethylpyrimidine kinase n=1 Tax=Roseiflexus castenholzii TaxID=120962 RepID=UPI0012EEAC6A